VKETIHIKEEGIVGNERASEKSEQGSIVSVILKRPILIFFALILFCYNFVYSQWSFMLPIQVVDVFKDAGAKYFGMMASLNGLVVMSFTPVITKMTEKINELMRAVLGGIMYTVGFGMLGFVNLLPFFFLSTFIFTLGEVILAISTSPFIANRTPSSHRGRMNAVLQIIMGAGYMIGPLVMGNVLNYVEVKPAWMILGAFASFATLLMYGLERYDERKNVELNQC
jgi:MFS family permease